MDVGRILPVNIYMTVCYSRNRTYICLAKTLNQYHSKCMRFSKMQLVSHCYTAVLYEPISNLYIYKNSAVRLSDARITFFLVFFFCFFFCVFFFFVFFFLFFFLLLLFFCFFLFFFFTDNQYFEQMVDAIYTKKLQLSKASIFDMGAEFLGLHLCKT